VWSEVAEGDAGHICACYASHVSGGNTAPVRLLIRP
jgi:hypothetical protein